MTSKKPADPPTHLRASNLDLSNDLLKAPASWTTILDDMQREMQSTLKLASSGFASDLKNTLIAANSNAIRSIVDSVRVSDHDLKAEMSESVLRMNSSISDAAEAIVRSQRQIVDQVQSQLRAASNTLNLSALQSGVESIRSGVEL